ncbi:hypothetical protein LRS13_14065 [Svornostia abyssi]|uniref:Uncharacterized protein n=1 Tax=Svornostia abyssi TaxID=2898438 RepID=A0ABY5PB04_9ACTN|nr:hypothetical protein LRS13_14065 [Parviterribacteraceae bacterium J379]
MTTSFLRRFTFALLVALACPSASSAAEPLFDNTGDRCRNFGIFAPVDRAVARELLPARYQVPRPAFGLVELASCEGGTLDGQPTGPYRIAEAAIVMPTQRGGIPFPLGDLNLWMLWLLDSDPALAAAKGAAGYPGGVADIAFTPPVRGATRRFAAQVGHDGGYALAGSLLFLSRGLGFPQINQQYGQSPRGRIRTTNTIYKTTEALVGSATATFTPGSTLAQLFGKTRVQGLGIAGTGWYRNTTVLLGP